MIIRPVEIKLEKEQARRKNRENIKRWKRQDL